MVSVPVYGCPCPSPQSDPDPQSTQGTNTETQGRNNIFLTELRIKNIWEKKFRFELKSKVTIAWENKLMTAKMKQTIPKFQRTPVPTSHLARSFF